ncbi:tRNA (N(6)-L-threonylcarbamoyladenosine(37)-C(2))-methylthiotransferase MtaB [Candidatus Bipolaricaulota bacterium]|nr:tRNA (N(6)-L-threonylcarbamoyladenosine(37)-C(2))-methylthiotransferase MtaB [Candidatus Bipolaricaulota bacterium]MBS3813869.1 tRNA (N(6)-L-threonylcarbamoyladenosine(37)-C(2))-methylthiotransferase MtaB [Candidatus Bipolaricaulota bacterium]
MGTKVAFYTLGCKSNQYDTEIMKEAIRDKEPYGIVPFEDNPDIYVINTCSVTKGADRKSRKYIRRAGRQSGLVLVTGCYTTLDSKAIADIDGVDMIFLNSHKYKFSKVLDMAESGQRGEIGGSKISNWNLDNKTISRDSSHTRGFVKIQDGCSNSCTFCKVHYLRGPTRSKSPSKVLEEVRELGKNGFREIVLTGINLAEYRSEGLKLPDLMDKLSGLKTTTRIRLSSINPEGITEPLVNLFSRSEKMCPYFHIPLQSGSNSILNSMNRSYSREYYLNKIDLIKNKIPGSTFGTDLMVGFPGESKEDFELTKDLVKQVGFSNIHVFRYSPRDKTPASKYEPRVDSSVKNQRAEELRSLAASVSKEERNTFKGEELEMILEEPSNKVKGWRGYSRTYLDLHLPERYGPDGIEPGDTLKVKITEVNEDFCLAKYTREPNGTSKRSKDTKVLESQEPCPKKQGL